MKIAVLKETAGETRCAAIPETVKKFVALGAEVAVERGAGEGASIADAEFEAAGAKLGSRKDVLKGAGVILCIDGPDPGLLKDAERLLRGGATFEPATTARRFVIAAPDFLATLLLPPLLEAAAREAPGISIEVVPSARRGNAWLLETGDLDLALGAIVDEAPGIRRTDLCTEGFACAVRKGHPAIHGALDLDSYVAISHLLITLGDDAGPTWIDQALEKVGRRRHVAARVLPKIPDEHGIGVEGTLEIAQALKRRTHLPIVFSALGSILRACGEQ